MKKIAAQLAVAAVLAGGLATAPTTHADAATVPQYKNCTALVKVYPHGVKKTSTTRNRYYSKGVAHYKATLAKTDAKVYAANARLDADKDGIACER